MDGALQIKAMMKMIVLNKVKDGLGLVERRKKTTVVEDFRNDGINHYLIETPGKLPKTYFQPVQ